MTGKPITCPACGGSGELPTENEGDRPAVICDMCGGAGWGIDLGPDTASPESRGGWTDSPSTGAGDPVQ